MMLVWHGVHASHLQPAPRPRMARALAAVLVAVCLSASSMQSQPALLPPPPGEPFDMGTLRALSFIAENDVFWHLGRNQDRNYTGGFAFQASGSFVRKLRLDAPLNLVDRLTTLRATHDTMRRSYYTLMLVGTGFTPDSLNTPDVIRGERPYGSILGLTARRLSVDEASFDVAVTSELTVGLLGLPIARNLQTWLHRRLRGPGKLTPYDPLGWDNQISNGGELTALYRVQYERRLLGDPSGPGRKHFQLSGGGQLAAGYYTNATALLNTRLGWFNSNFWEFSPAATNAGAQNLGQGEEKVPAWELFLFAGVRPRLIAYNALLQGQFRNSAYTIDAGDVNRAQLEWELGVGTYVPIIRSQLIWNAFAGRSAEFSGPFARTHTWGSFMLVHNLPLPRRGPGGTVQ